MPTFVKYIPHLSITALIIFLATDYFSPNQKAVLIPPHPEEAKTKVEGSHAGDNHMEGSHSDDDNLSQEEREKRMGIFHYNEGNRLYQEENFSEAIVNYQKALHHNKGLKEALINLSTAYMKNKMYGKALETLQSGQKQFPKAALIDYNFACYYSLTENLESGLLALKNAVTKGYKQFSQMESDPDLTNLRQSGEYKAWIKMMSLPAKI